MATFNEALKDQRVRELLEKQALQPVEPISASQLGELYAEDTEKYAKVIREVGIKRSD